MFTHHSAVAGRCSACGKPSLVQDHEVKGSDVGVLTSRLGTVRCVNPRCVKADLVGWAHEAPRPQRG